MTTAKLAALLMLTLSVASCVSLEPASSEKRLLISGILKLSAAHEPLSDEEVADAFSLTPKAFKKTCPSYECKSLSGNIPKPGLVA
jgi:hypothetical protein